MAAKTIVTVIQVSKFLKALRLQQQPLPLPTTPNLLLRILVLTVQRLSVAVLMLVDPSFVQVRG
jgi:hypothetical protein